jgi:hypothetical protein
MGLLRFRRAGLVADEGWRPRALEAGGLVGELEDVYFGAGVYLGEA